MNPERLLRIAHQVAGDVWDTGPGHKAELLAEKVLEETGDEDGVKQAILLSFDKAFGTKYAEKAPFFAESGELNVGELLHELLHHAISPDFYESSYDSELEGAVHEHAIRNYQSSTGGAEQFYTTFGDLGFDPDGISEEDAQDFLKNVKADVAKNKRPELKPIFDRLVKRIESAITKGAADDSISENISQAIQFLENSADKIADAILPPSTESNINKWFRQLELDLRHVGAPTGN